MRIPDELLAAVVPARRWSGDAARRRPDGGEARARAVHRRALARGGGGAGGRGALHARRARGTGARRRCRRCRCPDGDPVHLPGAARRRASACSTSEARRLIAQGGVKVDGEVVARARRARGHGSRSACPGRQAPFRPLDTPPDGAAIIPRLPERAAWKRPCNDQEALRASRIRSRMSELGGLWCESEAFLRRPGQRRRSLKTQQRAFTSRPRAAASRLP